MPDWLTQAFFNPELQRQRLNVHQYRENDNVITMRIMDDLNLADFVELQLKPKHDFDAAYDVALSAGLGDYVRFVVIQPGDWPCQFYCRQIIYRCLKKFTRHNPERGDFPADSNMLVSHNHSSYSFPSTTAYTVNCFTHNMTSQPSLLSIVPTIGPLHISLSLMTWRPLDRGSQRSTSWKIHPKSSNANTQKEPRKKTSILNAVHFLIQEIVFHSFD